MKKTDTFALASLFAAACTALTPLRAETAEFALPKPPPAKPDGRTIVSMNGTWQIAESVSANEIPTVFAHTVVVPGMVNLAKPAFPDVDLFASHEYLIRWGLSLIHISEPTRPY